MRRPWGTEPDRFPTLRTNHEMTVFLPNANRDVPARALVAWLAAATAAAVRLVDAQVEAVDQ